MDAPRPYLPALVLGLSLVVAALVLGLFFYQARHQSATVQVVGAATRPFDTDVAKWRLSLSHSVGLGGVGEGYGALARSVDGVRAQLRTLGVADTALSVQPPQAHARYDQFGQPAGYELHQSLVVVSGDVAALERLALNPGRLDTGGALLQGSSVEYYYADLPALKRALLAAATEDARLRAAEISGGRVGAMTSARAGVFQITEPFSTEVAAYGVHATATRRQEITVTVHATFATD